MLLWITLIIFIVVSAFAARKNLWGTPPDPSGVGAASQEQRNGLNPQATGPAGSLPAPLKAYTAEAVPEVKDLLPSPVRHSEKSISPARVSSNLQTPIAGPEAQLQKYVLSTQKINLAPSNRLKHQQRVSTATCSSALVVQAEQDELSREAARPGCRQIS